jgi:hypothetical protein
LLIEKKPLPTPASPTSALSAPVKVEARQVKMISFIVLELPAESIVEVYNKIQHASYYI